MANENFTTYTEVDAGGKLTVAAAKITAVNMLRNEDCYVYKDFGVNFFDALDIDFEIFCSGLAGGDGLGGPGLTVATINDGTVWGAGDVRVEFYTYTTVIRLIRGAYVVFDASVGLSYSTLYYCTLSRAAGGDTITCTIYSNAARTTVVDTLSVGGFGTSKYRYLYGIVSLNSGDISRWDGYVQNMNTNIGWQNIAKVDGVTAASIAKLNGVAVAGIAKVNGKAV